ncbi:MAG: hypothetical protein WCP16_26705, partial [Pseudanabaena sp. ELA645]
EKVKRQKEKPRVSNLRRMSQNCNFRDFPPTEARGLSPLLIENLVRRRSAIAQMLNPYTISKIKMGYNLYLNTQSTKLI